MRYDEEVIQSFAAVQDDGSGFGVVVFQPHLDPELTAIGLDTPDGRRWELDPEAAARLAASLIAAREAMRADTNGRG